MTLASNTYESGLASGTAITTANSANPTAFTSLTLGGGSINYSTTQKFAGSLAAEFNKVAGQFCYAEWLGIAGGNGLFAFRDYVYLTGMPVTAGQALYEIRSTGGGTGIAQVVLDASSPVLKVLASLSGTYVGTTTGTLAINTWYRIEGQLDNTGGTTAGKFTLRVYLGDSTTPISNLSLDITTANFGTNPLGTFRVGCVATTGSMATSYHDATAAQTASITPIGPLATLPPVPVVTAPANQQKEPFDAVTVTFTATNSPTSWSITQTSGTPVTLSVLNGTATFTAPQNINPVDVVLTATATNAGGTSAPANATVATYPCIDWKAVGSSWVPFKRTVLV